MPQEPLTDDELLQYGDHPDVSPYLNSEERRRLRRLRASQTPKTLGGFAGNVLQSGARFASDLAQPILHPIETAKGLATAATNPVETAQALGAHVADRYGSPEDIGHTLYEDPVGALADVSSLLTGGGGALRAMGAAGKSARVAKGGRALTSAGDVVNPLSPALAAAKGGAASAPAMYQSALKPSLAESNRRKIQQQVMTGLRARIPVSEGGQRKLRQLEDAVNARIDRLLAAAPGTDAIDKAGVSAAIFDLAADWERRGKPKADVNAILKVAMEWDENPAIEPTLTRVRAQELKRSTDQTIGDTFGELSTAEREAQKTKRRSLRVGIEQATAKPQRQDLIDANRLSGRFQELAPQLDRAVARDANRNALANAGTVIGLATGGGALATTGDPVLAAAIGVITKAMDSPAARSRIAMALQEAPDVTSGLIRAALAVRAIEGAKDVTEPAVP